MIDLHMHTCMSDGSDAPEELIVKLAAAGCTVFSVTDHDGLQANNLILSAMKERDYGMRFLTGCEISSVFEGRNLHLLCYGFPAESERMEAMIAEGARLRKQRISAIFDHLRTRHGIVIPKEDQTEILSRDVPGKVHVTDVAMRLGIRMSRQEFFDTCLDDMESRAYKLTAETVIDTVGAAGGAVSFAHAIEVQREYGIDDFELEKMIQKLKDRGLAALEVYHSKHGKREVMRYAEFAKNSGLLVSGGSDYHGKYKNVQLGQLTAYGETLSDQELTMLSLWES